MVIYKRASNVKHWNKIVVMIAALLGLKVDEKSIMHQKARRPSFLCLLLALSLSAFSAEVLAVKPLSRIVVFGTSISDPGNMFFILKTDPGIFCDVVTPPTTNSPPYKLLDPLRIPDRPYSIDGHHFSNGPTWIEQAGDRLGLDDSVGPAFRNHHDKYVHTSNYAVSGARAWNADYPCRVNLQDQLDAFKADFGGKAPSNALYVIEFGANDIRDALDRGDPTLISDAVEAIYDAVHELYLMGARKFVFATAPNIGRTWALQALDKYEQPGVAALGEGLSQAFNAGLAAVVAEVKKLPGVNSVKTLDVFGTFNRILNHPQAFHLSNVTDTCVTPLIEPYDCKKPDRYFFWDGIHPTKAVHGIFANEAITLILGTKQGHYH